MHDSSSTLLFHLRFCVAHVYAIVMQNLMPRNLGSILLGTAFNGSSSVHCSLT
ncbi:hypothetical protein M758_3G021700 [Ceratodon purpureus]|uniref:Uncharacterized protein n=1 Tax=Ceratodon purpureus TaxID=3225 RepID=A0A8T0J9A3_CERPU|nr:hypothetical protein KC19_1G167800 [Ceratodon purpureus]KAG0621462.1 hypothetical protein M758_3G021700 [Ceratodon purpureus]